MLPPQLAIVKNRLVEKGYPKRTTAEDELLAELEYLDKSLNEVQLRGLSVKAVGGPPGSCPCCGRGL